MMEAEGGDQEETQVQVEEPNRGSGLSVAPMFSSGGSTFTRAGFSLASMMAVAFLGTMTLG